MVLCIKQSFSMQRPTNCQGSVPFPTYALRARYANALFTCIAVRLCRVGQWLADIIIVAQIDYNYGKRQSISSSANPARMGQARKNSQSSRDFFSRNSSRLYQATTAPRDWRLFGHLLLHRPVVSLSWRCPDCRPFIFTHGKSGHLYQNSMHLTNRSGAIGRFHHSKIQKPHA